MKLNSLNSFSPSHTLLHIPLPPLPPQAQIQIPPPAPKPDSRAFYSLLSLEHHIAITVQTCNRTHARPLLFMQPQPMLKIRVPSFKLVHSAQCPRITVFSASFVIFVVFK